MGLGFKDGFEKHEVGWAIVARIIAGIPVPVMMFPYYVIINVDVL